MAGIAFLATVEAAEAVRRTSGPLLTPRYFAAGLAVSGFLIALGAAHMGTAREIASRAYLLGWRNGSQATLQILSEAEQVVTPHVRPVAPVRRLPAKTKPDLPTARN